MLLNAEISTLGVANFSKGFLSSGTSSTRLAEMAFGIWGIDCRNHLFILEQRDLST